MSFQFMKTNSQLSRFSIISSYNKAAAGRYELMLISNNLDCAVESMMMAAIFMEVERVVCDQVRLAKPRRNESRSSSAT